VKRVGQTAPRQRPGHTSLGFGNQQIRMFQSDRLTISNELPAAKLAAEDVLGELAIDRCRFADKRRSQIDTLPTSAHDLQSRIRPRRNASTSSTAQHRCMR